MNSRGTTLIRHRAFANGGRGLVALATDAEKPRPPSGRRSTSSAQVTVAAPATPTCCLLACPTKPAFGLRLPSPFGRGAGIGSHRSRLSGPRWRRT